MVYIFFSRRTYCGRILSLRGNTVRQKVEPVVSDCISTPLDILEQNRDMDVIEGILLVNNIPLLITIRQKVKFSTAENIADRKAKTLLKGLRNTTSLYNKQNVSITTLFMDNESEALKPHLDEMNITLNTTAASEHVPEIECQICVVKYTLT